MHTSGKAASSQLFSVQPKEKRDEEGRKEQKQTLQYARSMYGCACNCVLVRANFVAFTMRPKVGT